MALIDRAGVAQGRWLGRVALWAFLALTALLLVCIATPVIVALLMGFWSTPIGLTGGSPSLTNYATVIADKESLPLLWHTVILTGGASLVAVAWGVSLAWITTCTDVPMRRLVAVMPLAPLVIPPLMMCTAWILLYSPRTGLVNQWLERTLGLSGPPFDIYSMLGMIVVVGLGVAPVAYVIMLSPMRALDRGFDEAARIAGASRLSTFIRITIPVVRPAVISATALAALIVATSFEVPILLGLPGGVRTYMSAIYQSTTGGGLPDYNLAAAQSAVYLIMNGALLVWYLRSSRKEQRFTTVTGKGHVQSHITTGKWRWFLFAIVTLYFLFAFVQLVSITLMVSLVPFYTATSSNPFAHLTLESYRTVLGQPVVHSSLVSSAFIAGAVAIGTTLAAMVLAIFAAKSPYRRRRVAYVAGNLPIAFPPLVFAVALLVTVLSVPGLSGFYNTLTPLIVADVVVFLPFAMRIMSSAIVQIDDELLEAARVAGSSWLNSVRVVVLPLLRSATLYTLVLSVVLSFKELGAILLLVPPNFSMYPTLVFSEWSDGRAQQVTVMNVISVVILSLTMALAAALLRVGRKKRFSIASHR